MALNTSRKNSARNWTKGKFSSGHFGSNDDFATPVRLGNHPSRCYASHVISCSRAAKPPASPSHVWTRRSRLFSLAALSLLAPAAPQLARSQVVRMAPKAGACEPGLVDAGLGVSSLKDAGRMMAAEVDPMFAQVERTTRAQGRRLPTGEHVRVYAILQQAFEADAVDLEVQRSMKSHCDPKIFAAAVEQLRAPLPSKIRAFEDAFNRSHSQAVVNRYAASLQLHPPGQQREALIEALEKTVHQADFTADIDAQVILALYMGLSGQATNDAQFGTIRDQLLPSVRQATRIELLMIYRNVSDEDLDQYTMLLRTPALQRFRTICQSALQNAIVRRSEVFAAMIKQHLDEVRPGRR
jgi:hypothetical protein